MHSKLMEIRVASYFGTFKYREIKWNVSCTITVTKQRFGKISENHSRASQERRFLANILEEKHGKGGKTVMDPQSTRKHWKTEECVCLCACVRSVSL